MKGSTPKRVALAIAGLLALIGVASVLELRWRTSLLNVGWADVSRVIGTPFFHLGDIGISPVFVVKAILVFILIAYFSRRTSRLLRVQLIDRTSLEVGQRYAIERTSTYVIFVVGLFIALQVAGVNLNSLAVLGGALGIGIGFGLQAIASNFVSGLILLFERPIKVGDRVEVGDHNGDVIRIGARATWVRTNDNIVIVLPNTEFITSPVVNWTANDRQVRFLVPVGVSYSSDPKQVRELLLGVARGHADVLGHPPPDVIFKGFGDSSLDFELRVWTKAMVDQAPMLKSDLYFAIFEAFRENAIEIPFPQRDLHLRSVEASLPIERRDPSAPQA
jgi:small-conductance mechanosensitive channel